MISMFSCGHFEITICFGKTAINSIQDLVDGMRRSCGQEFDLITSVNWFLSLSERWNTLPVVVLLHQNRNSFGALLLHGTKFGSVPIGTYRGGYICGRGGVVGQADAYQTIIEHGTRALLRTRFAHTVIVTSLLTGDGYSKLQKQSYEADFSRIWQSHEMRSRLPLTGGMDGLLSRFSQKMRKNFRYYRKRAETDFGCIFQPSLSPTQAETAVKRLQAISARTEKLETALRRQIAVQKQPSSFSMGLIDRSGAFVSYISGWRQGNSSIVEWQLNQEDIHNASVSMAMRHYFLEHEIASGMEEVIFLAGTTPIWSRVCEAQTCSEFLATPEGFVGKVIRGIYRLVHPNGKVSQLTRNHRSSLHRKRLAS